MGVEIYPYHNLKNMENFYGLTGGCQGDTGRPVAPTGFTATTVDNTNIELGWDETSADFDVYTVERSAVTNANFAEVHYGYPAAAPGAVTLTDAGLTKNTHYYYRFRVKKRFKWSEWQLADDTTTNV